MYEWTTYCQKFLQHEDETCLEYLCRRMPALDRYPGETPLAWKSKLQGVVDGLSDAEHRRHVAVSNPVDEETLQAILLVLDANDPNKDKREMQFLS